MCHIINVNNLDGNLCGERHTTLLQSNMVRNSLIRLADEQELSWLLS
jgi:hypothetical protein